MYVLLLMYELFNAKRNNNYCVNKLIIIIKDRLNASTNVEKKASHAIERCIFKGTQDWGATWKVSIVLWSFPHTETFF